MAKKPIFDTSIYSDYSEQIEGIYTSALFPTIVLYELIATSIDDCTLQKYERWRITLNKINGIVNHTTRDWWETSKAIRRLYLMKAAPQTRTQIYQKRRADFAACRDARRFCRNSRC